MALNVGKNKGTNNAEGNAFQPTIDLIEDIEKYRGIMGRVLLFKYSERNYNMFKMELLEFQQHLLLNGSKLSFFTDFDSTVMLVNKILTEYDTRTIAIFYTAIQIDINIVELHTQLMEKNADKYLAALNISYNMYTKLVDSYEDRIFLYAKNNINNVNEALEFETGVSPINDKFKDAEERVKKASERASSENTEVFNNVNPGSKSSSSSGWETSDYVKTGVGLALAGAAVYFGGRMLMDETCFGDCTYDDVVIMD